MNSKAFHTILFHALYRNEDAGRPRHPYLYISVDEFDASIRALLENGIKFIRPSDLLKGGDLDAGQILLTFDDGYFNNFHALEVLEKHSVEALFFIVKHQIVEQKLFWWDVYFKNRIKEVPFATLYEEIQELKKLERDKIEESLIEKFGDRCFDAEDDFDRPMTEAELVKFSRHPLVSIGVHSASHEILTNCGPEKILKEMRDCRDFLENITGNKMSFISYPNGNFDDDIVAVAGELGFRFGITTLPGANDQNKIMLGNERLKLKRDVFPVPRSPMNVIEQVEEFRVRSFLE